MEFSIKPQAGKSVSPPGVPKKNRGGDCYEVSGRYVMDHGLFLNDNYVRLIHAATGWELDLPELERIGERICTLERAFNVREGITRKDDTLPWRVQHEPIPDGPSKGCYCPPEELDRMLDEYYDLRGWTREGIPTAERLRALGLDFAITG